MRIAVTVGTGSAPTALAAFDRALFSAGIANYNLLYLSSVIPRGAELVVKGPDDVPGQWGDRLYVVLAQQREIEIGAEAWAGLGWVQDEDTGEGLFVEHHGNSRSQVEALIEQSLGSMVSYRQRTFSPPQMAIIGTTCHAQPVCAVAAAVFMADGWD